MRRPLGAYYRLTRGRRVRHALRADRRRRALRQRLTHAGWERSSSTASSPPEDPRELPIIECHDGDADGGHAFASSATPRRASSCRTPGGQLGRRGLRHPAYSDWRQNAMDAWVVQLGVVTEEHEAVSHCRHPAAREPGARRRQPPAPHCRVAALSCRQTPTWPIMRSRPFVVDVETKRRLSMRGRFRTHFDATSRCSPGTISRPQSSAGACTAGTVDVAYVRAWRAGGRRSTRPTPRDVGAAALYQPHLPHLPDVGDRRPDQRVSTCARRDRGRRGPAVGRHWLERFRRSVHGAEGRAHRGAHARAGGRVVAADEDKREGTGRRARVGRRGSVAQLRKRARKGRPGSGCTWWAIRPGRSCRRTWRGGRGRWGWRWGR